MWLIQLQFWNICLSMIHIPMAEVSQVKSIKVHVVKSIKIINLLDQMVLLEVALCVKCC